MARGDSYYTDPSCTTATPDANGFVPLGSCNAWYLYNPSFILAIVATAVFVVLTIAHVAFALLYKKPSSWLFLGAAAILQAIASICGVIGAHNQQSSALASLSNFLYAVAPFGIYAYLYVTLARVSWACLGTEDQRLGAKRLQVRSMHVWDFPGVFLPQVHRWFLWCDLVFLIVQGAGAVMWTPGYGWVIVGIGEQVSEVGLGLQAASMIVFWILLVKVQKRLKSSTGFSSGALLMILYLAEAALTVRLVFRVIKYAANPVWAANAVAQAEWTYYIFDYLPVAVALASLVMFQPEQVGAVQSGLLARDDLEAKSTVYGGGVPRPYV